MSDALLDGHEIVIVGAGIAGAALAAVLARAGRSVLVLERDVERREQVRGEYLVPWGVAEMTSLGLLDTFVMAGANWTRRQVPYAEDLEPDVARKRAIDLTRSVPNVPGALCLKHSSACDVLAEAALAAGASVLRGTRVVEVASGDRPSITFEHLGRTLVCRPRLVVLATGRGCPLVRRLGFRPLANEAHHLLGGLLIGGAYDWPIEEQCIGVFGDRMLYIFPQGRGQVRLYAAAARAKSDLWSGPNAVARFLAGFRQPCLPHGNALAEGRPIGPLQGYPAQDQWVDEPARPGVLLIGDAAGYNDPSLGQGLALALRDVRLAASALLRNSEWSPRAFGTYVVERRQGLERLRFLAAVIGRMRFEFSATAKEKWRRLLPQILADPALAPLLTIAQRGPETAPSESFSTKAWERLISESG